MASPILTTAQMRAWEQASWAAGRSEAEVIQRVGQILARRAEELTRPGDFILLLAGKGNNGNDVRAAQPHLCKRRVELLHVTEPAAARPALENFLAQQPALIVDGLFGIGVNRPLESDWCDFMRCVNAAALPVLAVDIPSGLNADTGENFGEAIRACHTLTVGAAKIGLLAQAAWPSVGRLQVAPEIGLLPCPLTSELNWLAPEDFAGFPPARPAAGHKGNFGHLAIVAGSLGYHGAAVLATRGAQRAQPGLITTFPHADVYHGVAAQLQSAMVMPWRADTKVFGNSTATLFGPGLAGPNLPEEMKMSLRRNWLGSPQPVVVDASALDWIPFGPVADKFLRVITPHPGEAARMLNLKPEQIQADRVKAVRELSRRFSKCWVVLKGHQTLIGRSTGDIFVNSTGNPHLAQGGAGDVLAGFLAGLLAQPALQADAQRTITYAVWQHGRAADRLAASRKNWTIEELAAEIGAD